MKLISCSIENFGKLNEYERNFSEGITVFLERNAWGKSTLAAFIKVMFFGFAGESKKLLADREREKYRPWNKGTYGGKIVFEIGGKRYILQRTFGAKEKDDSAELYDAATNLPSKDFSCDNIGETLFGLDDKSFLRTVFVAQNEVNVQEDGKCGVSDSINAKIGNLTDATDDLTNYESVIKAMADEMNRLSPTRSTGQIKKLASEIGSLSAEVRQEETVEGTLQDVEERYLKEKEACRQMKARQKEVEEEYSRSLLTGSLQDLRRDYEEKKEEVRLKRTLFAGSVPEEDELANMQELGRELDREKSIMQENRLFAEDEERRKALAHTFSAGLPEQAELLSRKEQISRYKEVQGELAASRLSREEEERLQILSETYPKGMAEKEEIDDMLADWNRKKAVKAELVHKKIQTEFLQNQNKHKERLFFLFLALGVILLIAGGVLFLVSTPAAVVGLIAGVLMLGLAVMNRPTGKEEAAGYAKEVEEDEAGIKAAEDRMQLFFRDFELRGSPDTVEAVLYDMRRDEAEYDRLHRKKELAAEPEKVARAEEMLADITAYLRKFYPTIHINENNISESFELLWREALEYSELKRKKDAFDKAKEVYEDADEVIGAFLQKIGQTPHPDRVKQLKDIHEQLIRYHAAYEELEKASSKLKEFEESNADVQAAAAEAAGTQMRSKEEIQAEKQKLETDISDTERAIRAYEKQMEELRERAGSVEEAKERLEQLAEEKEELAHRYDVVDKTKQYLSQAKENLTARYRDPIMNGFNKYYEMLTGCLPREYKMDANISLTKEESGGRRQITALSSGWQDLVNICLRMALVDAMYKEEKPFLVMDDPFVNLDKEKMELAKGFLRAISKEYQVLYFTCHESRI